jgi:hypothetical protein
MKWYDKYLGWPFIKKLEGRVTILEHGGGGSGSKWYTGAGKPDQALGNIGDFYLDSDNGNYFEKILIDTWNKVGTLQGPPGPDGPSGADGAPGAPGADGADGTDGKNGGTWYTYPGNPNGHVTGRKDGTIQDMCLDTATGDVYVSDGGTDWTWVSNIHGADGADGADGAPGTPGADGIVPVSIVEERFQISTYARYSAPITIGRTYIILTYVAGDDFTNVGAGSNAAGVQFVATGTTPTTWTNGSVLVEAYISSTSSIYNNLTPITSITIQSLDWGTTNIVSIVAAVNMSTAALSATNRILISCMDTYGGAHLCGGRRWDSSTMYMLIEMKTTTDFLYQHQFFVSFSYYQP